MNFALEIVGAGVIVPAVIALGAACVLYRVLPAELATRYAAPVAFALAYGVGYVLLPSWAELVPTRHWQWTAYLAIGAAAAGAIASSSGLLAWERWLLLATAALVSAWMLVPTWASLQPPRTVWIAMLTGYLFLLATLLTPLLAHFTPRTMLAYLALTAVGAAVLIAALVSVSYGRAAGLAAAALAGCWGAAFLSAKAVPSTGLALGFAVLVGGWAYVGCIEPQRPLLALLLVPAAPLALWCCISGPLARQRGLVAIAIQTALVLAVLIVAAVILVVMQIGPGAGTAY